MNAQTIRLMKAIAMLAVTDELIKSSSPTAQTFLTRELRRAVSAAVDAAFPDRIVDSNTPLIASSGVTALDAGRDFCVIRLNN